MPISVTCPGCSAKMKASDGAAGKTIKCPKCKEPITVPAAEEVDDFEVVEDAPAKKPAPAAAKPKVKAEADEDEEDEKPKKKKKVVAEDEDEEDEDEKPKKKKAKAAAEDDEDGDEEKPKKKKKKKRSSDDDEEGVSATRKIISAVVLVILIVVAGVIFYNKLGNKEETAAAPSSSSGDPPAGPGPQGPRQPGGPGPKLPGGNPGPGGDPMPNPGGEKLKLQAANIGTPHWTEDGKVVLAPYITKDRFQAFGVWDRQTGEPLMLIPPQENKLFFSSFASGISPDRKQVVIISKTASSLTLWKVSDGSLEKTIDLPKAPVSGVSPAFAIYTPDGRAVVTAYEKSLLRVDLDTGTTKDLLKDVDILEMSYCAAKNIVVASNQLPNGDHELRVTDLNRPDASFVLPHKEDERLRGRPAISADGSTVVAYIEDRTTPIKPKHLVCLYDVATKQLKAQAEMPVQGEDPARAALSISADGQRVVCGYAVLMPGGKASGKCLCYDVPSKTLRQIGPDFDKRFNPMPITGDGKTIGIWQGNVLQLYSAETGQLVTS